MRFSGHLARTFLLTVAIGLATGAAVPAVAAAGTLVVTSDTTLAGDHYGSIVIDADNVTLDCAGWSVIGTNDSDDGIVIEGHSGVAVRNCIVQQFVYGIVVRNASASLLEHNEVRWNGLSGIDVSGSVDVTVRQNTMHENGLLSGYSGIDVEYGASDVVVSGNTSWGNAGNGFYTYQVSNLVFVNNEAFSNLQRGFDLNLEVTDSTFSNNRSVNNTGDGFSVVLSDDNHFIANEAIGNLGRGFQVHRSSGNVLRSNDVRGNGADGIALDTESSYNVIRDNDIQWNNNTGIPITFGSDWNLLVGNVSSHNGDGIRIETSHNTLLANEASDNTNYGFWVIGSYNKLASNSGCGNGILDALQEPDTKGNVWLANDFCTSDI